MSYKFSHVLIIPDGNRRWAHENNVSLVKAYNYVLVEKTTELIDYFLVNKKAKEFTIWFLAINNILKRKQDDLGIIFKAETRAIKKFRENKKFENAKIKFSCIGDRTLIPHSYRKEIKKLVNKTKDYDGPKCNILIAYDSKWEFIQALKKAKTLKQEITRENILKFLELKTPIDIVIRPGYEKRLSGCPSIQTEYAEFFFEDYHFPELTKEKLEEIIRNFLKRNRRFGGN